MRAYPTIPRSDDNKAGGIDKVSSFISLFSGKKLDIAAIADFATGSKNRVRDLCVSKLLQAGRIFTVEKYADQAEADMEDLLGRQFFIELVNRCYDLPAACRLPIVKPSGASERVVKEVETHFATLRDVREFDHYEVAQYLTEHWHELRDVLPESDAALRRFEQLFKDVNAVLT